MSSSYEAWNNGGEQQYEIHDNANMETKKENKF
jgi:hypothetical protein